MRFSRSLAVIACVVLGAAAFYVSYEAGSASIEVDSMPPRLEGLGDLLNPTNTVSIREMDPAEFDMFYTDVTNHPAWAEVEVFFLQTKGLPGWDWATMQGFVANVDGEPVQVFVMETLPVNGMYGLFVFAKDGQGNHQIWKMLTNIGAKSVTGGDPTISDIPVYTWSNGMPVYFVYVWHWFGGWWHPYHYLWHDSHNHPNWYYSYYNHWWWWHYWYGYAWRPWYNWFYAWWYWRFFYYWSTWFPY